MMAGLPISALGGVFYLILTIWMPICELGLLLQGRSSVERWKRIGVQCAMVGGVVAAILGQAVLLAKLIPAQLRADAMNSAAAKVSPLAGASGTVMATNTALFALTTLCCVALGVYALKATMRVRAAVWG